MENKITIVTAFFDINRKDFLSLSRSNDVYFSYFEFWARIKNDLIVFCSKEHINRILSIREKFGLKDRTKIIEINNIFEIESELLNRMMKIEEDPTFISFRYYNKALSNKANYDYIMLIKWWCMYEASKLDTESSSLAWVDFGFNHGGDKYTKSEDFDFYWEYPFEPDLFYAFSLTDPDTSSLIDSLQFQVDCIQGSIFIAPKSKCELLWNYMKEAMNSLCDIGCIDDDQMLLLIVYKKHKSDFKITICDWFECFLCYSNVEFSTVKKESSGNIVANNNNNSSLPANIMNKLKWSYKRLTDPNYPYPDEFIQRMDCKRKKYR